MKQSWIIAMREFKERVLNRSFLFMLFLGPLMVLTLTYFLVKANDQGKKELNVLIADPGNIMEGVISSKNNGNIHYYFVDSYLEIDEFKLGKDYQRFDVLVEINEKVLNNKKVFVFYRDFLSSDTRNSIKFTTERRIEEVLVNEFTDLTVPKFREIKQPLNMDFRNINDPMGIESKTEGWAGLFFGLVIFLFIMTFGMSIFRSVSREKSNRIVEVLVSIVRPRQLMIGKMLGIGLSALFQLFVWFGIIGAGMWVFQNYIFTEFFMSDEYMNMQLNEGTNILNNQFGALHQNEMIELIYERLNLAIILPVFLVVFILAYFFYGAFFSLIASASGSESDGQQFSIPIIALLLFSLYAGYFTVLYPQSDFSSVCQFVPFTSPVVLMVKICQGYPPGSGYLLIVSLVTLMVSTVFMLYVAGRIFRGGILEFGHSLSLRKLMTWLKSD
ncbi:MAG: ABC transporter permease [Crocinitomicaceae bacterium]